MPNNSGENDTGPKSEADPQKEQLKNAKILPTPFVRVWLLGIICAALCAFGGGLLNAQFFRLGWAIMWLGGTCGCIAARIWVSNHRTKYRMPGWLDSNRTSGIAILICAIACFFAAYISSPKLRPYPRFVFWLHTENAPDDLVLLTNDSLKVGNWGKWNKTPQLSMGYLFVPVEPTNVSFDIGISNAGPIDAEGVQLTFLISKDFNSLGTSVWLKDKNGTEISYGHGTDTLDAWDFFSPFVLTGNSFEATGMLIKNAPLTDERNWGPNIGDFMIMARAKGAPAQAIKGRLVFIPFITNFLYRPFVLVSEPSNGLASLTIDKRKILEMQKQ